MSMSIYVLYTVCIYEVYMYIGVHGVYTLYILVCTVYMNCIYIDNVYMYDMVILG